MREKRINVYCVPIKRGIIRQWSCRPLSPLDRLYIIKEVYHLKEIPSDLTIKAPLGMDEMQTQEEAIVLIFYDYYETILMMINKDLIDRTTRV